MRWAFLFVLLVLVLPLATSLPTLPAPPSPPGDPFPSNPYVLTVTMPSTVGALFNVSLSHDADDPFLCQIDVDGVDVGNPVGVAVGQRKNVTMGGVPGGHHILGATCENSSVTFRGTKAFRVAAATFSVRVTTPTADQMILSSRVDVRYNHTANVALECAATIDDWEWDGTYWAPDDERWEDADLTRRAIVAVGASRSERFILSSGEHTLMVYCSDGVQNKSKQIDFETLSVDDVAITITSPLPEITTSTATLTFSHNGTGSGTCDIALDGIHKENVTAPSRQPVSKQYAVLVGGHTFTVFCANPSWESAASRRFTVTTTAPVGPDPTLTVPSTVDTDTSFIIRGGGFPVGAVTLQITGPSTNQEHELMTSSSGAFTFTSPGLFYEGSYVVVARSVEETSILLTDTIEVFAPEVIDDPDPPVYTPPVPDPVDPYRENPAPIAKGGISLWAWLVPLIVVVLLIGGGTAYLVSTGKLDVSSGDAFSRSLQKMFKTVNHRPPTPITTTETSTIKGFIAQERAKGYDDLTIRSALIAKGWHKDHVDSVFDEFYTKK